MKRLRWILFVLLLLLSQASVLALEVVVAGYNVQNYSPLPTQEGGKSRKSAQAVEAVVKVIQEIRPDILGVCEMGSELQLADFQRRLGEAGLRYDYTEWVDGPDSERHLALLSRFPIASRQSLRDLSYDANGKREKVRRGFLDVTIQISERESLRVLGAHLKSKLANPHESDLMRRFEAHLLRTHVVSILENTPDQKLLIFGDFNDTKETPVVQAISGVTGAANFMTPLALEDSFGDRWTHYWKVDDSYQRIDYIFVNRALSPALLREKSYVYRSPFWNQASDHRPVVATFSF